jgi:hypothetical protein
VNITPAEFIPLYQADPEGMTATLATYAWEMIETTSPIMRWWPPARRSLAEIFGVPQGHPAGDIARAREHFDAHPSDLSVAELVEPGIRGPVEYTIMRFIGTTMPYDSHGESRLVRPRGFLDWYRAIVVRALNDAIEQRVFALINGLGSRIQWMDCRSSHSAAALRVIAKAKLPAVAGWLFSHQAAEATASLSLPVALKAPAVVAPTDTSTVVPSTCLCRGEFCGAFTAVADSMRVRVDIDGTDFGIGLEVWGGMGIDVSEGQARILRCDLGIA